MRCHAEAAQSWTGSLHQRSWTDGDFASVREPNPFCRSCHAPEADPLTEPSAEAAAMGVACVTCHAPKGRDLPGDAVLASAEAEPRGPSPHAVVRDRAFGTEQACAGCHEFDSQRQPGFMMQTTLTEHAGSALAGESCQSCHMPSVGQGRRSHGFAASRDPDMLRSAVSVVAARPEADVVTLTLRLGRIGHAFPTGDPFRRLQLELDAVTPEGLVPLERRALRREVETQRVGFFKEAHERADTRVGGRDFAPVQRFELGDAHASTVRWRLAYERLDVTFDRDAPHVFDRIVLYQGTLP